MRSVPLSGELSTMKNLLLLVVTFSLLPCLSRGDTSKLLLFQKPTVNRTHVVFVYTGDLWSVPREGGEARRLTAGAGLETDPIFSPDGTQIAFSGEYDGKLDVYVMPASGGVPRRLTYHPMPAAAVGWAPDGKRILFTSAQDRPFRYTRLFTVPVEGGFPSPLPLPIAEVGSYSPDGARLAYTPYSNGGRRTDPRFHGPWKRYRGGLTSPILIATLADSSIEKIPRENSNDSSPMWVGNKIYFLSDRNGPVSLFSYDTNSKQVTQVLENHGMDLKSASAGPDVIAYEQFGQLFLFDPATGQSQALAVQVQSDMPRVRPRFEKAAKLIENARLSPTGARAVFEARGEVLTVPADKGTVRNLTNTPGIAERDPAWSPDGRRIAYFSDESGEYQLHVRQQDGSGEVKKYTLGDAPSFYYEPTWSPDCRRIAYTDKRLNLWVLDLDKGSSTKVDTNTYDFRSLEPVWSPDSRWIAYTKILKNFLNAVFVYNIETGRRRQLTDGMSDARFADFDRGGKYLYFTASTDVAAIKGSGMLRLNQPATRGVYLIVLADNEKSPLAPQSDEEKLEPAAGDHSKKESDKKPTPVRVEPDGISQRILALPIPARNYQGLMAGKAGTFFLLEAPALPRFDGPTKMIVHRFDLEKRKLEKLLEDASDVAISHNGEKLLYHQGEAWFICGTAAPPKSGEGALKMDAFEVCVDPRAEWRQMYHEVWRIERDFLCDPRAHGLDLKATQKKYLPYLDGLASREDLNYLFADMLGELSLGHVVIYGGDVAEVKGPKTGLLGADYEIDTGRYRFAHIFDGENWNPTLRAPLTQPGARVHRGEYLLAVNGHELKVPDNVHRFFEGTADHIVTLKVGPTPDGKGAREINVVPVDSERALRYRAWIEDNRRKVDRKTKGRVAYVHVPDTFADGLATFQRYYFAQADKDGAIIDARFNSGGFMPDSFVEYMTRPLLNYISPREGADQTVPQAAIFGPKVMIINQMAGSGGDALPHYFRQLQIGPLVGERTWGGFVGQGGYPTLMDGGHVTAPHFAHWFPSGQWEVENYGVPPDVQVEFDPQAWRAGRDPQLDKAVELVLQALKEHPRSKPQRPPYPDYHAAPTSRQPTAAH
jgi:tricorn protease